MKTCPVCKKDYSDDLNYCFDDGSPLSGVSTRELTNQPTEVLHHTTNQGPDISNAETIVSDSGRVSSASPLTPPTQRVFQMSAMEPASRMGCVLSIGQVAAALTVVVGLGIVGWLFTSRGDIETVQLESVPPRPPADFTSNAMNAYANAGGPTATPVAIATSQPSANDAQTIAAGVLNEKAISLPTPPYPPAARAVRAAGTVTVEVLVDFDGRVVSANATTGHPFLRAAAVSAARSARFRPEVSNGKPVKVFGVIKYEFALPDVVANEN